MARPIIKNILPGMGNTGNLMSPLIPFNMIVDTDVGLLCTIFKSYMDPRIFKKSFFLDKTVAQLVYELYIRKRENPLYLCINEEYIDSCDNLYNEFMQTKYDEILDLSTITEFYRLVGAFERDSDIHTTIVCERQEEIDILRQQENTKDCEMILSDKLTPKVIKTFNQFYFKSIEDAMPYAKYLVDKTIYFANYGFNTDDERRFVDNPLIPLLMENNILNLIDVFNVKEIKGDEIEDESDE